MIEKKNTNGLMMPSSQWTQKAIPMLPSEANEQASQVQPPHLKQWGRWAAGRRRTHLCRSGILGSLLSTAPKQECAQTSFNSQHLKKSKERKFRKPGSQINCWSQERGLSIYRGSQASLSNKLPYYYIFILKRRSCLVWRGGYSHNSAVELSST